MSIEGIIVATFAASICVMAFNLFFGDDSGEE